MDGQQTLITSPLTFFGEMKMVMVTKWPESTA
jgi:hypothetical protein